MDRFFRPYEGKRPFLFISYAHALSEQVVETIRILHEGGVRLWYDEGIPAGSDWPANIAGHMQGCERVIFFLCKRALVSPNCFSEIRTAARQKKPMLVVRLDESEPTGEWAELLKNAPCIDVLPDARSRAAAILKTGFVTRRFRHTWRERIPWRAMGLVLALALFLGSAALFAAVATGRWSPLPALSPPPAVSAAPGPSPSPTPEPEPPAELSGAERFFKIAFPDALQETAVRRALGKPEDEIDRGELAQIQSLHLAGNMVLRSRQGLEMEADGSCRVNGAPAGQGKVTDLSLLPYMTRLEELTLVCQPLGALSPLADHVLLRELDLAGSRVTELGALTGLPSLETLHLEYTGVKDLTPLEKLPALKTVTVSLDMLPLSWDRDARFEVVLVR